MADETLLKAIELIRAGRKTEAQKILEPYLEANPHSIPAWLWEAETWPTTAQKIKILETCLQHNPDNQQVKQGLAALQSLLPKVDTQGPIPSIHQQVVEPETNSQSSVPRAKSQQKSSKGIPWLWLSLGLLLLLVACGTGVAIFVFLSHQGIGSQNTTLLPAQSATSGPDLTANFANVIKRDRSYLGIVVQQVDIVSIRQCELTNNQKADHGITGRWIVEYKFTTQAEPNFLKDEVTAIDQGLDGQFVMSSFDCDH
ncbi:MAG: hypothetical protein WBW94_15190 [Anaerolineales bacterium]